METKIQRWGNSLGLRIPKAFAEEARVEAGSVVNISFRDGELIIRPLGRRLSLDTLVACINPENLHAPVETGEAVGREVW